MERVQIVIENVWLCCETLKDCHGLFRTGTIRILVGRNQRAARWEQSKFQIAFEKVNDGDAFITGLAFYRASGSSHNTVELDELLSRTHHRGEFHL